MNIVKRLQETIAVYGLSAEEAARLIGCSGSQVRRWLSGKFEPTPVYIEAILRGIHKIKGEFAGTKGNWGPPETEDEPDEEFKIRMQHVFEELEIRMSPEEKYDVFAANPGYWSGFISYLSLVRKYKIELPK